MLQDRDLLSIQEVRDKVAKARAAFTTIQDLSQEQIDKIVKAMADAAYAHAEELAKMAVDGASAGEACTRAPTLRVIEPDRALAARLAPKLQRFRRAYPAIRDL